MARTVQTIPPDKITPADLQERHVVEVLCTHCPNGRVMPHAALKRGKRADKKLSELRFRCRHCKAITDHKVTLIVLPRNF